MKLTNMPDPIRDHITPKPRGKGSGLGLPVAKGIVSDHDGRIDVASEPGKGTEFLVSFPIEEAPAQAR